MSVLSLSSAPGRNRIRNLLIRSQTLYPAELRAHILGNDHYYTHFDPACQEKVFEKSAFVFIPLFSVSG